MIILIPLAAMLFSLRQQHMYQANAQVLLSRQNLASALTGTVDPSIYVQSDRLAQTQANLARVPEVAKRTLAAVGLNRRPRDLLSHSSVSAEANADLLDFSVTDHSPTLAIRLTTQYAKQFVLYRRQIDTVALRQARRNLQRRIAGLTDKKSPLYAALAEKEQQLATMQSLQGTNDSVVQSANAATLVQPKPVRNGILGLGLGLVLGLGLAFVWEALDTRVRSAEEIEERLGAPLLARLPEPPRRLRSKNQLAMLAEPDGASAEAFRMLRTNLEFVRLGHDATTIMVTSSVDQEGKSTTVANLAVALAAAGQRVALVDLDLRRPVLSDLFNLPSLPGLPQVAIGEALLDEALFPVPIDHVSDRPRLQTAAGNRPSPQSRREWWQRYRSDQVTPPSPHDGSLHIIAAGVRPPNSGEFMGSATLAHILDDLRGRFDTVLIDTPPSLRVNDAMALSSNVDAIFVVTRMNVVRRPMLSELRRLLNASRAYLLGFAVTASETKDGYGYEGATYYSGSYARAAEQEG